MKNASLPFKNESSIVMKFQLTGFQISEFGCSCQNLCTLVQQMAKGWSYNYVYHGTVTVIIHLTDSNTSTIDYCYLT